MKRAFCSIVKPQDLPFARAAHASLCRFEPFDRYVLVVGPEKDCDPPTAPASPNLHLLFLEHLCQTGLGADLYDAYVPLREFDELRCALKPVLMAHLLQDRDQVIYLDAQLMFCSSPRFLFDELNSCHILLVPQGRCTDPLRDGGNFEKMFSEGFFDAGLVGAAKGGLPALTWWAEACLYSCHDYKNRGHYYDQRYLNLMPYEFAGVRILQHRGCNVAGWNKLESRRELGPDGTTVLINGQWPVVGIHFAGPERFFQDDRDELLRPHAESYLATLSTIDPACARRAREAFGPAKKSS